MGTPDVASIQLVTYGDYQCPHTPRALLLVARMIESFGDELLYVFRNLPLTRIHPHAFQAALAAEAADRQHRFWDMHLHLFQHQRALDDESLLTYAAELGLDQEQFARDFASEPVRQRVLADVASGEQLGVSSTPTFFANGVKYDGPVDGIADFVTRLTSGEQPAST